MSFYKCFFLLLPSSFLLSSASATLVDLMVNGEFENPVNNENIVQYTDTEVTGWNSTSGNIELVNQGIDGLPVKGIDGSDTGQVLRILKGGTIISTDPIIIPDMLDQTNGNTATLYLDYIRLGKKSNLKVSIVDVASGSSIFSTNKKSKKAKSLQIWKPISKSVDVEPGKSYRVEIIELGNPSKATCVDQVTFTFNEAEEPTVTVFDDIYVKGITRIDGGLDLIGSNLSIFETVSGYESGVDPVVEIKNDGTITLMRQGDIFMGQFGIGADQGL